jgi:hypothetical protein
MDLSIGSHHFQLSVALLAGLALAVGAFLYFGDGATLGLDRWLAAGRQEVQTAAKYRTQLADATGRAAAAQRTLAHLSANAAALRRSRDSAQAQLASAIAAVDSAHRAPLAHAAQVIGAACQAQEANCEQRAAAALQARDAEHARAELATSRTARADSIIAAGLKATQCKILVFGCLSRTRSAEVGYVLGVVSAILVIR